MHHSSSRYPFWNQKVKKCYLMSIAQWNRPPDYLDTSERNLLIVTNLCHLLRQTILEATSPYNYLSICGLSCIERRVSYLLCQIQIAVDIPR